MTDGVGLKSVMDARRQRRRDLWKIGSGTAAATVSLIAAASLYAQTSAPADTKPAAASAAPAASTAMHAKKPAADATTPSAKDAAAGKSAAASPKSNGSYSIGVSMGEQMHRAGLTPDSVSLERLSQGIRDALAGKATISPADQENIATLLRSARTKLGDANHATAQAFLAQNGKKSDVVTTASGLEYHVITPGEGASPKSTDEVTVNYRGTLLDGTEFDSSYKRGQPATFPVNGVIPGWQEALVLMKPGAKWQLFVPPKLAYDLNSPPTIPPGSLLVFDVELISVKPPAPPAPAPGAATTPAPPPPAPK